ncbi:gluconate permease [Kocuria sediminis]|uniref:Gluconate permease n=1 Tax=Kocuria sediminis TaxID=1038857 RepID=A0A6N8GPS7_9MICC|nr:gluconate permease [Kocuria sediminis]
MSATLLLTAIAIIGIVLMITALRVPPVFALLVGTFFLGLTTIGPGDTPEAVAGGFGEVMAEIGLLVSFGVIMGALITKTGALQGLIETLMRTFGAKRLPYIFSVSLSSVFTSIYSDVVLVLTAPMAKRIAPQLGPRGIALMGGALTAGIEVGLVFVVPGVAALAVAGLLGVPLGQMFIWGIVIGLPTAVVTMFLFSLLAKRALKWSPDKDELIAEIGDAGQSRTEETDGPGAARPHGHHDHNTEYATEAHTQIEVLEAETAPTTKLPLLLALAPVVITLTLVASGALLGALGIEQTALGFITDPVFAMFLGAGSSYLLARTVAPRAEVDKEVADSLVTCGPILVLSGVSGSLGAIIDQSGLADILSGYFTSSFLPPLLLVWLIAAVLHIALGSISISAITAAGILAPIAGSLGVDPVLVALAAGSGALFLPHVSSNFFWMFKEMLGLSTRGTFKTHTVAMSLASIVSLVLILGLSVVL